MSYIAKLNWTCVCGHENEAQLFTSNYDQATSDDEYDNFTVTPEWSLHFCEPCENCGSYELEDEPVQDDLGKFGWCVVEVKEK